MYTNCVCGKSCANAFIAAISTSTLTSSPEPPFLCRSTATYCKRTRNPPKRFGVSWEAMPAWMSYPFCVWPGVIGGLAPPLPETDEEQDQLGKALDTALREALLKLD